MELLDLIESQLISNRLPLVGVTLAALPCPNTPTVLSLHWHGFVEVRIADDANAIAYQPVPSSALQVNTRWDRLDDIEYDLLETAWELGSWNLERIEARPFDRLGAPTQETKEALVAFGAGIDAIDGEPQLVAEAPDATALVETAGRAGYIQWLFRPVRGGVWSADDDETLEPGGYRNPTCPLQAAPLADPHRRAKRRRVVYPFGKPRSAPMERRYLPGLSA